MMTTASTDYMIGETLGPGDMTILLVDLKPGEQAEAVIYAGLPGQLITDGQGVASPDGARSFAIHWQKRLEWHIHNTTNQPMYYGLRYTVQHAAWNPNNKDSGLYLHMTWENGITEEMRCDHSGLNDVRQFARVLLDHGAAAISIWRSRPDGSSEKLAALHPNITALWPPLLRVVPARGQKLALDAGGYADEEGE